MSEKNILDLHPPVIVLGANHSGTRVIVEMLEVLGSESGKNENAWLENELFLQIHKELIYKNIGKEKWDDVIFNVDFINSFEDDCRFVDFVSKKIENNIFDFYSEDIKERLWHWKCPTSALFLKTWKKIFPNAYFIHIKRSSPGVMSSLMRRRQIHSPWKSVKFNRIMNEKIESMNFNKYIRVDYSNLMRDVNKIAEFIPIDVSSKEIKEAKKVLDYSRKPLWFESKSIRKNIWSLFVRGIENIFKLIKLK